MKRNLFHIIVFIFTLVSVIPCFSQKTHELDSLTSTLKTLNSESEKIDLHIKIAEIRALHGEKDSAILILDMLAEKAGNEKLKKELIKIFNAKGKIYREHNEFVLSENFLKRAYKMSEIERDTAMLCETANNLGITYRRLDDDSNALLYHILALKFAKHTGDLYNLATALNSLGIIYVQRKNYDKGIEHFTEALGYEQITGRKTGIAINYNSIAWAYEMKGDFRNAERHYQLSIDVNTRSGNKQGLGICYNDLGNLYAEHEIYKKALQLMHKAYKIFTELKDDRNLGYSCLNLGKLYNKMNQSSSSLKMLNQCMKIAENINAERMKITCYEELSKTYENIGYFAYSLEYLRKAYELRNGLKNIESEKLIAEYRTKYEYEKKEEQIALLTDNNSLHKQTILKQKQIGFILILLAIMSIAATVIFFRSRQKLSKAYKLLQNRQEEINVQKDILKQQKQDLENLNTSKDKFFSIIAHDLRNPFSALLALSALVIDDFDNNTSEENREMVRLINESAENGYRLLENLLSWAKSQSGGLKVHPEKFHIKDIVAEVVENMELRFRSKNIQLIDNIKENVEIFADRNMILSVLRNLISNALKFTPQGGTIELKSNKEDKFCRISVIDNGIGIDDKSIKKLFRIDENFTRKGTDKESGSGLGLILCKEFVEKNNGNISVESKEKQGSNFNFTIPLA